MQHMYWILDGCEPICSDPCQFSNCTAPDTCTCHPGYSKLEDSHNICIPACDEVKCLENSVCNAPNSCECSDGFENDFNVTEKTHSCDPICHVECVNGQCIKPEVCQCNSGYEFSKESNNTCIAVCEPECLNGNCTSPNQCDCFEGFMLNATNHCFKYCSPECFKGECIEGECICDDGYFLFNITENICQPDCREINCFNGGCQGNNTCFCEDGFNFILDIGCQAHCSNSCVNGNCTEPEICSCFEGYQFSNKSNFECEPVCGNFSTFDEVSGEKRTVGCINGECTAPEVCSCFEGFILNDTYSLECIEKPLKRDDLPTARASGKLSDRTAKT